MMQPFLTTSYGVLFKGNCLEILGAIESNSIDCIFADPPFNLAKDYKNGFNDDQDQRAIFSMVPTMDFRMQSCSGAWRIFFLVRYT